MSSSRQVGFQLGTGTAIVAQRAVALIFASADDPACTVVAKALDDNVDLGGLVAMLSSLGFDSLPDFAIFVEADSGVRFLQRGRVSVDVTSTQGEATRFAPARVTTWREEFVTNVAELSAGSDNESESATFWISGGVVPAGRLRWNLIGDRHAFAPSSAGKPSVVVQTETVPPIEREYEHELGQPASNAQAPEPSFTPESEPEALVAGVSASRAIDVPAPVSSQLPIGISNGDQNFDNDALDFSNLFSHTVMRHPEDAAVRIDPSDAIEPVNKIVVDTPPVALWSAPVEQSTIAPDWTRPSTVEAPAVLSATTSGIIAEVPVATQSVALPEVIDLDGDHDGHTVARPRKTTSPTKGAASDGTQSGTPMVQAVRCIAGHLNPPTAGLCRVCEQAVTDRAMLMTPRPQLGVLRFSTNEEQPVNGPVIIGRSPPLDHRLDGEQTAVVAIDNSELSRFHCAVHVAEWYLQVADQGSTNGMVVIPEGKPSQTLRPFEKVQIMPGTIVDLGGAVTFRFDVS